MTGKALSLDFNTTRLGLFSLGEGDGEKPMFMRGRGFLLIHKIREPESALERFARGLP